MKVIFLDIDGVINSQNYLRAFYTKRGRYRFKRAHRTIFTLDYLSHDGSRWLNPVHDWEIKREAVKALSEVVEATGAKVVISSVWRKGLDRPTQLDDLFRVKYPQWKSGNIIDTTDWYIGWRSTEIMDWVTKHPDVTHFIAYDDDSVDMVQLGIRFIHIPARYGLTHRQVDRSIRMLMKDRYRFQYA